MRRTRDSGRSVCGSNQLRVGTLRSVALLAALTCALLAAPVGATIIAPPGTPIVPSFVAHMSADELAGQRTIYSYTGLTVPAALLSRVRAGQAAGVILFGDNIASRSQLDAACRQLQAAAAASPVKEPLLLMTDQEGGEVRRLPGAPTRSEQQIGASNDGPALAAQAGANAARNLRAYGLNVDLAPDADVARSPSGFIGEYHRSYGSDASRDGALAGRFIAAQQAQRVASAAKHFPGLGTASASQDTDAVPVTLPVGLRTLRDVDEVPFRDAIAAGVKLVMVSWAVYPALDRALPAGLSAKVIEGELRGRLGFTGVTITDALGAGALTRFGDLGHRAVLAARAGADLLLATTPGPRPVPLSGPSVVGAVAGAISSGELSRADAEQAVARVLVLRRSLAG